MVMSFATRVFLARETSKIGWVLQTLLRNPHQSPDPFSVFPGGTMTDRFKVVIDRQKQYSIWPADRENALGWNDVGKIGTREQCLKYIEEVWTDLTPPDLRQQLDRLRRL
jgi:MbtH protein